MAQSRSRPQMVAPRSASMLEAVRTVTADSGGFDPDVWHVMDQRDNELIEHEILYGAGSSKYIYKFNIAGQQEPVTGISVVGARHLAAHYKGLKHRLVSATQKTGGLFVFTTYPASGVPMQVHCSIIPELETEPDFYSAVCEMDDIKTGNTIQIERKELRFETKRGGGYYDRPHYATIAQSKAYRNCVTTLVDQELQIRWKAQMIKLEKEDIITESVIDLKRAGILQFATGRGIALDRQAIEKLTFPQISGLRDAAEEGLPAFVNAAKAMGLEIAAELVERERAAPVAQPQSTQQVEQRSGAPEETPQGQSQGPDGRPARRSPNFEV